MSFNDLAFCLLHRKGAELQCADKQVSSIVIKYTTVLNHLSHPDSKNKLHIDDTIIVFWADTSDKTYVVLTSFRDRPS